LIIEEYLNNNCDQKLLCSDCSCEELLQPCEACPNYPAQKPYGSRDKEDG